MTNQEPVAIVTIEQPTTKPNPILNLLTQRKFWMAFLGFIAATIMFATSQIDANAWLNSTMLLVTLVITGNVAEDIAQKRTPIPSPSQGEG